MPFRAYHRLLGHNPGKSEDLAYFRLGDDPGASAIPDPFPYLVEIAPVILGLLSTTMGACPNPTGSRVCDRAAHPSSAIFRTFEKLLSVNGQHRRNAGFVRQDQRRDDRTSFPRIIDISECSSVRTNADRNTS
jgi:hypothetical protein